MQPTQKINDKVSVKQLIMVIVVMSISPAVRFLPSFTAKAAEEAGWISPLAAMPPIYLTVYFIHKIFSKAENKSAFEMVKDILGNYIGTAALIIHLIWVLFLTAYYVRFNGERLVSSIYPNVDLNFFIIMTLVVVSIVIRSGPTVIARMGEILFPILLIIFFFVMGLLLPYIRVDTLLPISFKDAVPILKASTGTLSAYAYLFVIFLFSDNIIGKKKTLKLFGKGTIVMMSIIMLLLLTTYGMLGSSVAARAPIPFLITVKQISILDTIENIESVVVAQWMLADAILISTMTIIALNISKNLFKLSDTRNLINIFFVFIFLLSNVLARHRLEIDTLARTVVTVTNIVIGFGTPALLFFVGKLRGRI